MSLDNLVGISLEKIKPDSASIARLLAAARRNIADATIMAVSSGNRFDAAYREETLQCRYRTAVRTRRCTCSIQTFDP